MRARFQFGYAFSASRGFSSGASRGVGAGCPRRKLSPSASPVGSLNRTALQRCWLRPLPSGTPRASLTRSITAHGLSPCARSPRVRL